MVYAKAFAKPDVIEVIKAHKCRIPVLPSKDIPEALTHAADGLRGGETRDRSGTTITKRPEIIDAVAMVGMIVGPEDRINTMDFIVEELGAQVRGRIDENASTGIAFQKNRHPCAAVLRLIWIAKAPVRTVFAPKPGNTGRRSAAENNGLHAEAFLNNAKKLQVVASASSSSGTPRN